MGRKNRSDRRGLQDVEPFGLAVLKVFKSFKIKHTPKLGQICAFLSILNSAAHELTVGVWPSG